MLQEKDIRLEQRDVAVVITTYNQENYILECLESVKNQTLSERIHLYIHDDYSTDLTRAIIEKFVKSNDIPTTLIFPTQNKLSRGLSPLLDSIRQVSEVYIAFCNGDDFWIDKQKLEEQVTLLEGNPKVSLVHTGISLRSEVEESPIRQESESKWQRYKRNNVRIAKDMVHGCEIKESATIVRRSAIDFEFLKNADHIVASDWILYISVLQNGEAKYIDKEMVVHRVTKLGVWNGSMRNKKNEMKDQVKWYASCMLLDKELRHEFRLEVSKQYLMSVIREIGPIHVLLVLSRPIRRPLKNLCSSISKTLKTNRFGGNEEL